MHLLAERVGTRQAVQLGDHLGVAAQVQVSVDAQFRGLQPHLGQPGDLAQRQRVGFHIRERLCAP